MSAPGVQSTPAPNRIRHCKQALAALAVPARHMANAASASVIATLVACLGIVSAAAFFFSFVSSSDIYTPSPSLRLGPIRLHPVFVNPQG